MNIDWFTVFAQILNFLILVWLLKYFLYGPITQAMKKRQENIELRLKNSAQKLEDAKSLEQKYQMMISEFNQNKEDLMEQAKIEANDLRKKIVQQAKSEIELQKTRWMDRLEGEFESIQGQLRQDLAQQIMHVSKQVLRELADGDLEQEMVKQFLLQIKKMNNSEHKKFNDTIRNAKGHVTLLYSFEMTPAYQKKLEQDLKKNFSCLKKLSFQIKPEYLCGLSLEAEGVRISWNFEEYLKAFEHHFVTLLQAIRCKNQSPSSMSKKTPPSETPNISKSRGTFHG